MGKSTLVCRLAAAMHMSFATSFASACKIVALLIAGLIAGLPTAAAFAAAAFASAAALSATFSAAIWAATARFIAVSAIFWAFAASERTLLLAFVASEFSAALLFRSWLARQRVGKAVGARWR